MDDPSCFIGARVCLGGEGLGLYGGRAITIATRSFGVTVHVGTAGSIAFEKEINAVSTVFSQVGFPIEKQNLSISSTVPTGYGLASSATLMYAIATTMQQTAQSACPKELVEDIAYRAERDILGVLVGRTDTYAVARRGILYQDHSTVPSTIRKLPDFFPRHCLFVAGSHPSAYSEIGKRLKEMSLTNDEGFERYQAKVRELIPRMRDAILGANETEFSSISEDLYTSFKNDLGILNPNYENLREVAFCAGAVAAKNVGVRASGGSIFALVPNRKAEEFSRIVSSHVRFVYKVIPDNQI